MTDHVQPTSIVVANTDPAISFAQAGDSWSFLPLLPPMVISSLGDAVVSTHDNNSLYNYAQSTIAGVTGGVSFTGGHGAITNYFGGAIVGKIAILVNGDTETIDNSGAVGSLAGDYGVVFGSASNHVTLTNFAGGAIRGHLAGVRAFSDWRAATSSIPA